MQPTPSHSASSKHRYFPHFEKLVVGQLRSIGLHLNNLDEYRNERFKPLTKDRKAMLNYAINMVEASFPKEAQAFEEHPDFTRLRLALGSTYRK